MANVVFVNLEQSVSILGTKLNVESITEPKNVVFVLVSIFFILGTLLVIIFVKYKNTVFFKLIIRKHQSSNCLMITAVLFSKFSTLSLWIMTDVSSA